MGICPIVLTVDEGFVRVKAVSVDSLGLVTADSILTAVPPNSAGNLLMYTQNTAPFFVLTTISKTIKMHQLCHLRQVFDQCPILA